ncbi:MAG: helix-turn-helix domain-containing protein [Clostridiales bacterium]
MINNGLSIEKREGDYLTLKETAALADTPYAKVKRDIDKGILPAYHIGRKYFIKKDDLQPYKSLKEKLRQMEGYTIRQLMDIIPLSYAFIMGLIRDKKLEAVKVGRQYIILKESFDQYIADNKANKNL